MTMTSGSLKRTLVMPHCSFSIWSNTIEPKMVCKVSSSKTKQTNNIWNMFPHFLAKLYTLLYQALCITSACSKVYSCETFWASYNLMQTDYKYISFSAHFQNPSVRSASPWKAWCFLTPFIWTPQAFSAGPTLNYPPNPCCTLSFRTKTTICWQ